MKQKLNRYLSRFFILVVCFSLVLTMDLPAFAVDYGVFVFCSNDGNTEYYSRMLLIASGEDSVDITVTSTGVTWTDSTGSCSWVYPGDDSFLGLAFSPNRDSPDIVYGETFSIHETSDTISFYTVGYNDTIEDEVPEETSNFFETVGNWLSGIWDGISDLPGKIANSLSSMFNWIVDGLADLPDKIADSLSSMFNWIVEAIDDLAFNVTGAIYSFKILIYGEENVEEPDIPNLLDEFNDFEYELYPDDGFSNLVSVLSVFGTDSNLGYCMVASATFMVVGYILFGKRG